MPSERAWSAALAEHETVLAEFLAQVDRVPPERWRIPSAPDKWSPAEEAYHVLMAYEFGLSAAGGGAGMRLRVSPVQARVARWLVLPFVLRTGRFPRGAAAPREVRPPRTEAHALSAGELAERLRHVAAEAALAVRDADARRPPIHVVHAYFGALRPLPALRLMNAHTRHHTRNLALRSASGTDAPAGSPAHRP